MNRKNNKIISVCILLILMVFSLNIVYARFDEGKVNEGYISGQTPSTNTNTNTGNNNSGANNNWWNMAGNFWSGGSSNVANDAMNTLEPLVKLVKTIGNMIFVAVTVILGVKYIWGGVESKASVKDSLVTLVIAALVFYGWNTISALFMSGNKLSFITGSATDTASRIYSIVLYIANFLAVGGIVYIGMRYMMAGAEGRAQLKAKGVPIVLGIIMVYATITFLNLIVGLI